MASYLKSLHAGQTSNSFNVSTSANQWKDWQSFYFSVTKASESAA